MNLTGRFNTITKNKIKTGYGIILKVTHYEDGDIYEDYKIRPKCGICGGNVGCICFNDDNSNDPLETAIESLQKTWSCEKSHCICEYLKNYSPDKYKELVKIYGNDEGSIAEELSEEYIDGGEDIFCEV